MPVITIRINTRLSGKRSDELLRCVSELTSSALNKPLDDVMVMLSPCAIAKGGKTAPAAFIDCRHIGSIGVASARSLCTGINASLQKFAGIEASRIYANFTEVGNEQALRFDGVAA